MQKMPLKNPTPLLDKSPKKQRREGSYLNITKTI
jgi:hypothetical protein